MGAIILETEARIPLTELTVTDYILITLASWRLIRLGVYDSIMRFTREQFMDAVKVGRSGYRLEPPKRGSKRALYELFTCPWCFGVWAVAVVIFLYLISPYTVYLVLILALSAVASLLQIVTNLLGHKAELAKRESEEQL